MPPSVSTCLGGLLAHLGLLTLAELEAELAAKLLAHCLGMLGVRILSMPHSVVAHFLFGISNFCSVSAGLGLDNHKISWS